MAQILDPIPNGHRNSILCCYVNATSQIQIARITNIAKWYFERVVFPGQRLVFEALPEALLEIHSGMMASAILSDTIPCDRLSINDGRDDDIDDDGMSNSADRDKNQTIDTTDNKSQESITSLKSILVSAS
ncbi:DUF1830 domain-containing protein [Candidatus Gracilibacteria bacterium]|nr:DUF1830 domain-containing protein [Candidatus Gracilibacteria bacterium]NJM87831.1 DUF1830 domain-containing protein [Hydrococcus sp. RU_2_2]NJP20210.1 DUF1830 domain-containing protein [Hydrococcus sp. CRU_1_1]